MSDLAIPAPLNVDADTLFQVCRANDVETLDLFGSAVTPEFDPERSDVDLIVRFKDERPEGFGGRYFRLLEELERLFGRKVDLLTDRPIKNPYLRASVERQRRRIFPAS